MTQSLKERMSKSDFDLLKITTWSDGRVAVNLEGVASRGWNLSFRPDDVTRLIDLLVVPRGLYHHHLKWYHNPVEAQRWLRCMFRRKLLKSYTQPPFYWNAHSEWLFYDELYRKETFELNLRGQFITKALIERERSQREAMSHTS